jgi:acetate kinase
MSKPYLILNAGSSSLRFALFEPNGARELLATLRGHIEGIPSKARFIATRNAGRNVVFEHRWTDGSALNHEAAALYVLDWVEEKLRGELAACGHRVVHGGIAYEGPALISAAVLTHLETLVPLAPLHQPHNLALIRIIRTRHPDLPQVACFDTAFHRRQPRLAQLFALPREISERGVYRYGFHGLSYEHIASVLPNIDARAASGRTVVAHLGSGASLCALHAGQSIATTMGMSPLDGLPMGTRCGALDPAVVFYLMRELRMQASEVEQLLYERSGLLGVSGGSGDMRVLRRHAATDSNAAEAIALLAYRITREIGALVAILGGIDGLVFTAGIGENDAALRADVLRSVSWLGFELDDAANAAGGPRLTRGPGPHAWAVPADEEAVVARHTHAAVTEVANRSAL